MAYDPNNIFARILRGEIPAKKVYEDEHALAFDDIHPQAKVHVLVIPKGAYVSLEDFSARASDAEIAGFIRAVGKVARQLGLVESGYRILANHGPGFPSGGAASPCAYLRRPAPGQDDPAAAGLRLQRDAPDIAARSTPLPLPSWSAKADHPRVCRPTAAVPALCASSPSAPSPGLSKRVHRTDRETGGHRSEGR